MGHITEDDIANAEATNAIVIGFHIKEDKNIKLLAEDKGITLLYFDIIYKLLEDIKERLSNIKEKKTIHKLLGKMKVLAVFKTTKGGMIFGGKIIEGIVNKNSKIKVLKNGEVAAIGEIIRLQSAKEDVNEVAEGNEAGIEYKGEPIIEVDDTLEFFEEIYE